MLRRPSELAAVTGQINSGQNHKSGYRTCQELRNFYSVSGYTVRCICWESPRIYFCGVMPHGGTPPPLPPPRWVVSCRSCFKSFVHSYVGHARNLEDYLRPTEPVLPNKGVELECPKC